MHDLGAAASLDADGVAAEAVANTSVVCVTVDR